MIFLNCILSLHCVYRLVMQLQARIKLFYGWYTWQFLAHLTLEKKPWIFIFRLPFVWFREVHFFPSHTVFFPSVLTQQLWRGSDSMSVLCLTMSMWPIYTHEFWTEFQMLFIPMPSIHTDTLANSQTETIPISRYWYKLYHFMIRGSVHTVKWEC